MRKTFLLVILVAIVGGILFLWTSTLIRFIPSCPDSPYQNVFDGNVEIGDRVTAFNTIATYLETANKTQFIQGSSPEDLSRQTIEVYYVTEETFIHNIPAEKQEIEAWVLRNGVAIDEDGTIYERERCL